MDDVQKINNCTNMIGYYCTMPLLGTCYIVWTEAGFSYIRSKDVARDWDRKDLGKPKMRSVKTAGKPSDIQTV
jgi:hypothetical protein